MRSWEPTYVYVWLVKNSFSERLCRMATMKEKQFSKELPLIFGCRLFFLRFKYLLRKSYFSFHSLLNKHRIENKSTVRHTRTLTNNTIIDT